MSVYATDVCIVGGGPAGMILGLLLAKTGIKVLVLEQHKDFAREYRGEVLMPRFIQMMKQIGLYDDISKVHHIQLERAELHYNNKLVGEISFKDAVPEIPYALWMPQTELLQALHQKAREFPNFNLWFLASGKSIIWKDGKAVGVHVQKEREFFDVSARITVGTDGRFSTIRRSEHFEVEYKDYHFDIIWFTIPKPAGYTNAFRVFIGPTRSLLALPKYPSHIQCGLVVKNGEFAKFQKEGIDSLRNELLKTTPLVYPFANSLKNFSEFNVLQAELDMVKDWEKNGLLLIGDAAHTCSPVGAIGVSVAVETAIVAANVIQKCLEKNDVSKEALNEVQTLRYDDIRKIHDIQKRFAQTLLSQNPLVRFLLPYLLPVLTKTNIFRKAQRQLAALPKPLNINDSLIFK